MQTKMTLRPYNTYQNVDIHNSSTIHTCLGLRLREMHLLLVLALQLLQVHAQLLADGSAERAQQLLEAGGLAAARHGARTAAAVVAAVAHG